MASFLLWCQHADCVYYRRSETGGELPTVCPACKRIGRWLIEPHTVLPYTLDDLKFLRVNRIRAD